MTGLDRLAGSGPTAILLEKELKALVGANGGTSTTPATDSAPRWSELPARESAEIEPERVLPEFDLDWARALVRESGYRIHEAKNDTWDQTHQSPQSTVQLGEIAAAVGLAQNLAALRALATVGIQKGHMSLHAKNIVNSVGCPPELVDEVVRIIVSEEKIRMDRAKEVIEELKRK